MVGTSGHHPEALTDVSYFPRVAPLPVRHPHGTHAVLSPVARRVWPFPATHFSPGPCSHRVCWLAERWVLKGGGGPVCVPVTQQSWPRWEPKKPSSLGLKIIRFASPLERRRESRPKEGKKGTQPGK